MSKISEDGVLTEQTISGFIPDTHATGSALDLRTASLLDPSTRLYGENMRRRGSDVSRVRPLGLVPEAGEVIELARIGPDAVSVSSSKQAADIEAAMVQAGSSAAQSVTALDTDGVSSSVPFISPAERQQQRRRGLMCFGALCWCFFLAGWNDGSTGPLLPTIQRHYDIGFAIVSLLFVMSTVGFVIGAISNVVLADRLGTGKTLVIGACAQLAAYGMLAPAGPFPLMCAGFGCAGFGLALQTSQANGFVGSLKDSATKLGFLHAFYGLGAFSSPLVATQFSTQHHWSFHYLISLGLSISNIILLTATFRLKTQDQIMAETGEATTEPDTTGANKIKQILSISTVHFLAVWAIIYVGVEVTLGGWIVTFIEQKRGGGASAGYISSGFFGGLMLGRVLLLWLNRKIGERRVMFIYAFLAIVLEVTIWIVPSLIENAIAVSFIGLLLGPMFPILVNHSKSILPKWLFTGCVGWIAGVGQTGSAILPFATGLLASRFGITSLQPFIVSMMSTMIVIWAFVPRIRRVD